MDLLNNLAIGFGVAFTVQNLLYAFFGCVLGTLIGVLPGLGPVATIAMLLPSIYALDAPPALIMLAGLYAGADQPRRDLRHRPLQLRHPGTDRRHRLRRDRDGHLRLRRDHRQSGPAG